MANRNCFYDVGHRLQGFIEEGRCCDAEGRPVCRFTGEGRFEADEAGGPTVLYTLRMDGTITAGATGCVCARIRPDGLVFGAALHPGDEPLLGQFDDSALLQYCAVPPRPQAPVPTFLGCTPVGDWLFSLLLAGVVTALCLLLRVGLFDGLLPASACWPPWRQACSCRFCCAMGPPPAWWSIFYAAGWPASSPPAWCWPFCSCSSAGPSSIGWARRC